MCPPTDLKNMEVSMKTLLSVLLLLVFSYALGHKCSRCGFDNDGKYYPAYSKQLDKAIQFTVKRMKVKIPKSEWTYLNHLVKVENRYGYLLLKNRKSSAFGLGQLLKLSYKRVKVPYGVPCASCQVEAMIKYVTPRYRSFSRAWSFWNSSPTRHYNRKRKWY